MTYEDNSQQETEGVRAGQKQKFQTMMEQITFRTVQEKRFVQQWLKRKERPMIEPSYYAFNKNLEIYTSQVKNNAYTQLNQNEWYDFIDKISKNISFGALEEIANQAEEDDEEIDRSVSFVGQMVKKMNSKVEKMKTRESQFLGDVARAASLSEQEITNQDFSLILSNEWQKERG